MFVKRGMEATTDAVNIPLAGGVHALSDPPPCQPKVQPVKVLANDPGSR